MQQRLRPFARWKRVTRLTPGRVCSASARQRKRAGPVNPSLRRYRHDESSYIHCRTRSGVHGNTRGGNGKANAELGACREQLRGSQCSSGPRAVCGRIVLVRGDRMVASSRTERDFRTEPADNIGRRRGGDTARAGPAGRADRASGAFLLRHDRDGGRRRSESFRCRHSACWPGRTGRPC